MNDIITNISLWFTSGYFELKKQFISTLIVENRWKVFLGGLKNTLIMAFFALILGVIVGTFIAIIKVDHEENKKRHSFFGFVMRILNFLCDLYITILRGTPVLIQLMIIYFVILIKIDNALISAVIAFGLNSGAYVAEIIRAGIMSIDRGQREAGRSLGLTSGQTMRLIILPQAIKNILPALGNEFITLLKETSVAGYISIRDITKAGDLVRSRTFNAFFPLILVACVYLVIVIGLSALLKAFERRLRRNDIR